MGTTTPGRRFAQAVAAKDPAALAAVLADDVDFKGLTPGRLWEGGGPADVIEAVFGHWFGDGDEIQRLLRVSDGEPVGDTHQVSYRVVVRNTDGEHTVEQQGYYRERDGRIAYLRLLCSGYRRDG